MSVVGPTMKEYVYEKGDVSYDEGKGDTKCESPIYW